MNLEILKTNILDFKLVPNPEFLIKNSYTYSFKLDKGKRLEYKT